MGSVHQMLKSAKTGPDGEDGLAGVRLHAQGDANERCPGRQSRRNKKRAIRTGSGSPAFGTGCACRGWFSLLARNRFASLPVRIAMAVLIAALSLVNGLLWLIQTMPVGRKIDRTKIEHDPIFVIGHWRSGTTLLHELLVRDPRHTYPDTYACFAPNHFLVSAGG